MNFEHLYALGETFRRGELRVSLRQAINDPFAALRGDEPLPSPLICTQFMGRTPHDVVGTGYAALVLLSDRVIEILRQQGFTGWASHPVEVHGKDGEPIPGYQLLIVKGRCGPIDNSRSQEVWRPPPRRGGQSYKAWLGLYFDPATWDGSDIFLPEGTGWTIVVERVKEALERAKVTNIEFKRLTEVERTFL